jgi:hypothetical protein
MLTANRLQYMSNSDKLNVSSQLLDRGIMSINDVREIWNLPPVDGGDARIIRGEYWNADEKIRYGLLASLLFEIQTMLPDDVRARGYSCRA